MGFGRVAGRRERIPVPQDQQGRLGGRPQDSSEPQRDCRANVAWQHIVHALPAIGHEEKQQTFHSKSMTQNLLISFSATPKGCRGMRLKSVMNC
jgi:hypothetical protein